MSEYDFKAELRRAVFEDGGDPSEKVTVGHYPGTLAALRRAYAAGQSSGGGADLDRLVTLAAGIEASENYAVNIHERTPTAAVAARAVKLLSALKAQAVAK